ncbi:TetR/AcrR family transcriptional regulator [Marinomonas mediterranea]|jgi:Transcriptional regulator|uniref:Regulatory protein TetR n=1 Tax=Marinomonas mediterranea (strain ATCC 700492 / JCM 21426 / NBRC 103028 / MMB-1) TaxID=717774 RepID=F2JZZ4_MARM1|nr:TetR/AcrR family transcriptional regulator [Marinomonas mediterranea]ADZ92106.1 regulatory protein TetR [Marinomonas mediterranea MMB-1]WCN10067.1 TetR family transcriptional regulator [Marinomonas mediterranea]WCN14118.1 TetR family transcriptional regulator [Marinomonas mediterranea]WCN18173.1 TetR family transcriptional regulator [Marinomonas mediterranea MMB-1]
MARGRPSKKGLIAEAAQRLFNQSGYQGTSIDQVVVEAKVSKPTVYSNYASKLLLWQEVLQSVIDANQTEFKVLLDDLITNKVTFAEGWINIWQSWVESQNRMVVYRIHWGESHKLTEAEFELFKIFESQLKSVLIAWMEYHQIPKEAFFPLNSMTKEACLIRKLSQCDALEPLYLLELIESLVS